MKNEPKFLKIMRISTFLLFLCIFSSFAANTNSQNAKVYIRGNNLTINDFIDQVEKQTDYLFVYSKNELNPNATVSVKAGNKSVAAYLADAFSNSNIKYSFGNDYIVLTTRKEAPAIVQQGKNVTCIVRDAAGPVVGANVMIKGTTNGTITNSEGRAVLQNVPRNAILVVSFIGYVTDEIEVGNQTNITVDLKENAQALEEVVVVGYGTMNKRDLTGSIAKVTSKDFNLQPMINSTDALMGRMSGVMVSNTSGNVDASVKIRIRGANSINGGNDPLYVVDGVVGAGMPPSDNIASLEVLKDASATAIYGSRGANGVILITTKTGQAGKTVIQVNGFLSNLHAVNLYDKLDAYNYGLEINTLYNNVYSDSDLANFKSNGGTDWQKETLKDAWRQKYNVSVSGGIPSMKYHIFGEYSKNASLIKRQNDEGFLFRSNLSVDLYKNLNLQVYLNGNYNNTKNTGSSTYEGGADAILFNAITWGPTESIYENNGSYNVSDQYGAMGDNPVMTMLEKDSWNKNFGISGNMALTWQVLPSLSLQYRVNVNLSNYNNYQWNSSTYTQGNASAGGSRSLNKYIFQNVIATWKQSFDKHNLDITAVGESTKSTSDGLNASGDIFSNEILGYWGMSSASSKGSGTSWSDWSLLSGVGRVNYNYDNKYYLTGAIRADGSSKFADGHKWGYFPSGSIAWRASEENFIKDLDIFSNLKLRLSYGITGNQGVGSYSTIASLEGYNPKLYGMNDRTQGYSSKAINKDLEWEKTKQFDAGLDFGFLNDRFNVSFDYYRKNTHDLLLTVTTPYYLGGDQIYQNKGKVRNTGFEMSINAIPVRTKDIYWDVQLNLSKNKNKIIDLGGEIIYGLASSGNNDAILSNESYILKEGLPLGELYGYKCLGIWQTNEADQAAVYGNKPGDYKYEDLNGDNKINASDRTNIGNGNPDLFWGLNSTFRYKKWDLNVLFQGVHGADKLNVMYALGSSLHAKSRTITLSDAWNDRWTTSNPSNTFPNIESVTSTNYINSTQWVQDASFVRLKNLSVGYTFDKAMTKILDCRLYVSAQNLFTITNYKGYDPEASSTLTGDVATGIDSGITPSARIITFGAQLTF